MNQQQTNTFKVCLIGDAACGKTTFVKRHMTGEFEKRYLATLGVEVTEMPLFTNKGEIILSLWDTAGQEKFSGLKTGYYTDADLAIFFLDLTNRITYKNIDSWIREFKSVCPNSPIIIVGNKADIKERKVKCSQITTLKNKYDCLYFDISAKSNYNYEKPLLFACRILTKENDLLFTEAPAILPPVVDFVIQNNNIISKL